MPWQSDPLETVDLSEEPLTEQGAYPMVQPIRAALYFDNVKGFGEWRILISSRADKMLRKERKANKKTFRIMIKKIKELSNGHFSPDNQKRLNGPSMEIPIFEAKMTRDLRLVYQIDCIPEYESDLEIQVIKIFGIYTHAQLDGRFWDFVGYQLQRRGKEYSKRCNFRNRSHHISRDVILPGVFPPPEESILPERMDTVPQLPVEYLDDVHSLLDLEKYVALSQVLLTSILANEDVQHVFSVSRREKEIIEHPYSCYVLGRSGTGKTTTMLFKMLGIERAWETRPEDAPKPRQLFVTQSRMLAEKVEEYFAKLMESLSNACKSQQELIEIWKAQRHAEEQKDLVDHDDVIDWRNDLPDRFSLLGDEHFPLFLTFDHLCKLLEADIMQDSGSAAIHKTRQLVSPAVFSQSYWPHFPQTLTKGLDSSAVFSEIIGVIKGSEEALDYKERFLDQKRYEELSSRTQFAFARHRVAIYQLFQSYLKLKQERGDYDAADRTRVLIQSLEQGVPGQKIDYLYVDEAQDNLLIDALILRALCKNPHGLFWAGDTAQTIAVGCSFRFDDLKAFLFRVERKRQERITNSNITQLTVEHEPRMFQLTINYRSHGGIVNCAHSVVELITKFWPYSIDSLAQEQGVVDGMKPLFLGTLDQDSATYEQFLFGANDSHIELGAHQCIIVRTDAARNKLRERVGDIGMIMTPYESKGLEFDDVLLYHFFQDSTVDLAQWRVVLNALEPAQQSKIRAPSFNKRHYAGLCNELKILYVSLTRARRNVWIMDGSETSEPMRIFWAAKGLVTTTSDTELPRLAVGSSLDEWESSGRSLFSKKRYAHAMQCFQRASLSREEAVAEAYLLRDQARAVPPGQHDNGNMRSKAFIDAAEAFVRCALSASVGKRAYYRTAAACFKESDKLSEATQNYLNAEDFDSAAKVFCDAQKFDDAVHVVKDHRDTMQSNVVLQIVSVCARHYFETGQSSKGRDLFSSDEDALNFTKNEQLHDAHVVLLVNAHRFVDAADFLKSLGRLLEAHKVLVQDFENKCSMRRVIRFTISGLWQYLSLGLVKRRSTRRGVDELLHLATQLNGVMLEPNEVEEISMFRAIASRDIPQLLQLGRKFIEFKNNTAAVLCHDQVFCVSCRTPSMSSQQALDNLSDFFDYTRLLRNVADTDPSEDSSVQQLLGIQPPSNYLFLIPSETELHSMLSNSRIRPDRTTDDGMWVSRQKLFEAAQLALRDRLRETLSLVGSGQKIKRWPLSASLLFIREVIYDKIPIDTTILCDVLERICGFLIILRRYQPQGTLHNIVLPRGWLLDLLKDFKEGVKNFEDDINHFRLSPKFVRPLEGLLRQIYSKPRPEMNYTVLLSRICRCLCLLGYNCPLKELQSEIMRVISSLPSNFSHLHNLAYYKNVQEQNDFVTSIHKSTLGSPADDLILLYHESEKPPEMPVLPVGVTRVVYKHVFNIPGLLIDPPRVELPVAESNAGCNGSVNEDATNVANADEYNHSQGLVSKTRMTVQMNNAGDNEGQAANKG